MERRADRAKKHKQRPEIKIAGLISTPDFRKLVEAVYTDLIGQDPEFKKMKLKID